MRKIIVLLSLIFTSGLVKSQSYGDYRLFGEVAGNGFAHPTQIYFDDDLWTPTDQPTYGWDPCCDANFFPGNAGQPFIYTEVVAPPIPTPNYKLSINGLPHLFEPIDVPLGFIPGTLAEYTFTFSDLYTLPQGTVVELEDLSLQVIQDLMMDSTYTTWGAPSDGEDRFVLHFNPSAVTNVEENQDELAPIVVNEQGYIRVRFNRLVTQGSVRLFDISGRTIGIERLNSTSEVQLPNSLITGGIFLLEVREEGKPALVQKLVF